MSTQDQLYQEKLAAQAALEEASRRLSQRKRTMRWLAN